MFNPRKVKGYSKLSTEHKELFERFCTRFYNVWEYPENHSPVNIKKAKGYLKVVLSDGDWLHILENGEWY